MDALRNLLLAASSQDPRGLANAENQLKTLEIQPGFHAALLVSPIFFQCRNFHTVRKSLVVSKNSIFRKKDKNCRFELSCQKLMNLGVFNLGIDIY